MNTTNEGATISSIKIPENGRISIEVEGEKEIMLTARQLQAMMVLFSWSKPKAIVDNLRKGFMEVCVYKFVSEGDASEIELDKDFVNDFNAVCEFFDKWSKEVKDEE